MGINKKIKVMKTIELGILRVVLLSLIVGSLLTCIQLKGYGLFFAFAGGYLIGDFLKTFKTFQDE